MPEKNFIDYEKSMCKGPGEGTAQYIGKPQVVLSE